MKTESMLLCSFQEQGIFKSLKSFSINHLFSYLFKHSLSAHYVPNQPRKHSTILPPRPFTPFRTDVPFYKNMKSAAATEARRRGTTPRPRSGAWRDTLHPRWEKGKSDGRCCERASGGRQTETTSTENQPIWSQDHSLVWLSETKPCRAGPPKTDRVIVERSERTWSTGEGNGNHFSILALRTPWTVWKVRHPAVVQELLVELGKTVHTPELPGSH